MAKNSRAKKPTAEQVLLSQWLLWALETGYVFHDGGLSEKTIELLNMGRDARVTDAIDRKRFWLESFARDGVERNEITFAQGDVLDVVAGSMDMFDENIRHCILDNGHQVGLKREHYEIIPEPNEHDEDL